jgi:sarcosine oxidase subunit gamma
MIADEPAPDWPADVAENLADAASVFDQSSGYAILCLSGLDAGALLQKGAFLDLHPGKFKTGSVAVTVIEHIGAIVWRADETLFEIAVFRSFASSFWHWLVTAAAAAELLLHRAD